jgi:hypothetical protein
MTSPAPILTDNTGQILTAAPDGEILTVAYPTSDDDIEFFDFSVNLLKCILWQYNEATTLQALLQSKQQWYNTNQENFWWNWYYNVFNLRTANDFGCNVWSIILDLPLFVSTPPTSLSAPIFGFDASFFKNFNRGNFGTSTGGTAGLSLQSKRYALQLRYFQLTTSGTVPEINRFMSYLFGQMGQVYLRDNHDMTQTYLFGFPIPAQLAFLFDNFDVLPRPAGVGSTYRSTSGIFFGFGPSWKRANFNRGNFQS